MKKLIAVVLALAIMMSISFSLAEKSAEVPKIVIYNNSGAIATSMSGTGSNETAYKMVQDYILEHTGILVETITAPLLATEATEKLNLLLASGETIDIWWGKWPDYYDTGMIMKWNDLVAADDMKGLYDAWNTWDAWSGVTDSNGNIWGLPRMVPMSAFSLFYRQDWLDQLGYKMPSTMEELNAYLYAVKEADPYGNNSTVPLLCYKLEELEDCFLGGFVSTGSGAWMDKDGSVKPEYLADGYVDFVKQINAWYNDGIINKEAFSWDRNTVRDYIAKGQSAVNATWYSNTTLRAVQSTDNVISKDGAFDIAKHPYVYNVNTDGTKGANGNYIETMYNTSSECLMINANSKNVKACLDYINWQYEDWYNYMVTTVGLEGVHWQFNPKIPDAKAKNTYSGWSDDKGTAMYPDINGNLTYENTLEYCRDFTTSLGLPFEALETKIDSYGRQDEHNVWIQRNLARFATTVQPGVEYGLVWNTVALEEACYYSDLETYANENTLKFMTGDRSMDEWDSFVKELYDMGLQDMINEYTRQYNNFIK